MIVRIGTGSAEATTVTIPSGHQAGDLLIIFAFRDGSATNPGIPSGWTNITNTLDGTSCSASVGWKIAISSSDTSGTWTNATGLLVIVLRNTDGTAPIMTNGTSAGTTNTVTYNTLTNANLRGAMGYYIFAFCAHRSTDVTIETAPSGMSNILKHEGATNDLAMHEASSDDTWASTNASITGTASGWITMVLAIRPARFTANNYISGVKAGTGNAGILSVGERIR